MLSFAEDSVQMQIAEDTHRFRVIAAGRRAGKTWLNVAIALKQASDVPGSRTWYVTPDWKQAPQFVIPLLETAPRWAVREFNKAAMSVTFRNGSVIECRNATHYDRLRSAGLDLVIMDEYQDCSAHLFDAVVRPMLADRGGRAVFSGTPKGLGSHFHELSTRYNDDWRSWHFTALDTGTVSREEIESAKRDAEGKPTAMKLWRREWMADWTAFTGQIFEGWDASSMVFTGKPPSYNHVAAGMDWGFSESHAGALIVCVRDSKNDWFAVDEVINTQGTIGGFWLAMVRQKAKEWGSKGEEGTLWLPDDRKDGIREFRQSGCGWQVRDAHRDPGSVWSGILSLAGLMESGRLRVHERCGTLIRQIPSYHWEETKSGLMLEKPHKAYDDALDAFRYALHSEASRPQPSYA